MYSDGEPDAAADDQTNAVHGTHRFKIDSDDEGNVVCDRNGNIDCRDDGDETDPLVMLSCRNVPANHKMVKTGGSCNELIPAVRLGDIMTEDNLKSSLWSNDVHQQDRKLLSDSSAACKKMCANFCGKILDLQDDCEVTRWTVLPVKPDNDDETSPNITCDFMTCRKMNSKLSKSPNSDVETGVQGQTFLHGEITSELAALLVTNTTATKSILVSNSTHPNRYDVQEPVPTSSKRVAPKGSAASKSTPSSENRCHNVGREEKTLVVSLSNEFGKRTEEIKTVEVKNQSINEPCGKKPIHKVRHVGRKNRTKSKSMGETVELKLKVNRRHEPCQLVSCTPLISDTTLLAAPLLGSEAEKKVALESVEKDVGERVNAVVDLDNNQIDAQVFTPVKTHSKRSLAKTMSVCLDDSLASSSHQHVRRYGYDYDSEPIHMTLEEVKTSLQRLYGQKGLATPGASATIASPPSSSSLSCSDNHTCYLKSAAKATPKKSGGAFHIHLRPKKAKDGPTDAETKERLQNRKSFPSSIKQTFCSLFGTAKKSTAVSSVVTDDDDDDEDNELPVTVSNRVHSKSSEELSSRNEDDTVSPNLLNTPSRSIPSLSPFVNRALPPLPLTQNGGNSPEDGAADLEGNPVICEDWDKVDEEPLDFTASIQQVKDYGWYWGPISGELAEKILANEPDGSFIVRDSSDEHYIFSLTFKLNGLVRHVRIEHDQGNFSFGTFTNFKSQTIVGFIESAVKHSRSGRYLFFLHRRPVLGPMRVQLLHPVSRFKQVQSLQHMCRFVILKAVRRDLIYSLPLPKRLKDYLNTPQYYTEDIDGASDDDRTAALIPPAVTPEQNLLHGAMPDADR